MKWGKLIKWALPKCGDCGHDIADHNLDIDMSVRQMSLHYYGGKMHLCEYSECEKCKEHKETECPLVASS